jgi:hypothetical protein
MAAIKVNKNNKTQRVTLSSSEFPSLKVEGSSANESSLRKQLNAMMREKRRKSGGPTGKSPTEKKVEKAPEKKGKDVENMTPTKIGALGDEPTQYKSKPKPKPEAEKKKTKDAFVRKQTPFVRARTQQKNKGKDVAEMTPTKIGALGDEPTGYTSAMPEKPQISRGKIKKPSFMSQRKWDAIPVSQRKKVLANIKRIEGKSSKEKESTAVNEGEKKKSGHPTARMLQERNERLALPPQLEGKKKPVLSQASHPLSAEKIAERKKPDASPFVGPDQVLEQKEVSAEKLAELDAIDSKLKGEAGQRGQIEYGRKTYDQQETPQDVTNEDGGLMKKPDAPRTGEISEEPVKYDKNGYPIYAKGSKKAADWNKAYANAPVGEFMWDGRKYMKEGKPEEDEKAAVETGPVRQDYSTGDANIAEELGAPEHSDLDAQESQALQQSDAQAEENENIAQKIVKIKERTSDYESRHREIQDVVKPLNKEDTASSKEAAGDWYVDPWTGFAIDLNKLQARTDRKDAMEFAALLPPDQRAAYLSMEGLIEPEDLEKLLEPSELEQLQLQQAQVSLKTASYNLVTAELKRKDYRTPEQIEAAELKKTTATEGRAVDTKIAAEKRAEATLIRKEDRAPTSNKVEMDRWAGLFKNAITNDDFAGQVYWGTKMNLPKVEMVRIAKSRAAWEVKVEKKESGSAFKEIFEFDYGKVSSSREKLLMGTASLWEDGQIDLQMGGRTIKSREGLLHTLGIEDYEDMTAEGMSDEEATRMISSQSDLAIFKNEDYQDADGNPDWLSILNDEDVYKQFVLNNAIYKGMNAIYGGEYADIRTYEAKRRKKRYDKGGSLRAVTTNNQG